MNRLLHLLSVYRLGPWGPGLVCFAMLFVLGCGSNVQKAVVVVEDKQPADPAQKATDNEATVGSSAKTKTEDPVELSEPIKLFDGKSLENWEEIEFGGEEDEANVVDLEKGAEDAPVVKLVNLILIDAIKNGGAGNWVDQTGGIPMPANFPRVSQEDTEALVDFILSLP